MTVRVEDDPNVKLEQDAAEALKDREEKAIQFDIKEMEKFREATAAAYASGDDLPDLAAWQLEFPNPYRDAPAPIAPVPNPAEEEFFQQEQQHRLDEQPGAGMPGLGGGGFSGGAPAAPIAPQAPAAGPAQAMGNPSNPWPPEQAHRAKVGDMIIPAPGVPPMVKEF